jgi:4-carboxymuconolactone decarboxylase
MHGGPCGVVTASTAAEIGEILLHTSVYAGVPAANRAFAIADEVLGEGGSR